MSMTADQVPENYREPFIFSGYRHPSSSFIQCLYSTVKLNNETLNIWTHLIPFLALTVYFILSFPLTWPLSSISMYNYPVLSVQISILAYLLGSAFAHTFNCMSPRIRHICFYIDYTAISVFGVAGSCATFFYLRPSAEHNFILYRHPNVYIAGSVVVNLALVYVSCISRHSWITYKYAVRTVVFSFVFIYGNFPNYHRFYYCMMENNHDCPSSITLFILGYSSYIISAALNITRVPERFFPRTFDVIGHNHQWVHIVTTLGTLSYFCMVQEEMQARKHEFEYLLNGLNGWNTFGCIAMTVAMGTVIITWLGCHLTTEGHLIFSSTDKGQNKME